MTTNMENYKNKKAQLREFQNFLIEVNHPNTQDLTAQIAITNTRISAYGNPIKEWPKTVMALIEAYLDDCLPEVLEAACLHYEALLEVARADARGEAKEVLRYLEDSEIGDEPCSD